MTITIFFVLMLFAGAELKFALYTNLNFSNPFIEALGDIAAFESSLFVNKEMEKPEKNELDP